MTASNSQPHPIPFIIKNDQGKYFITEESKRFFTSLGSFKFAPTVISGVYRGGKSSLSRALLLDAELLKTNEKSFSIGHTTDACTVGIHIHPKTLEVDIPKSKTFEKMHIIFMDSEGIGANSANTTHDKEIMCLSQLSCSQFLYNISGGRIEKRHIIELAESSQLTRDIIAQLNSAYPNNTNNNTNNNSNMDKPSFTCIIRDLFLDLKNKTPLEYLESALSECDKDSDDDIQLKKDLKNILPERYCIGLPRPVEKDSDFSRFDSMTLNEYAPEFRKGVKQLLKHILATTRCKTFQNRPLTGVVYLQMMQSYVDSINQGAIPEMRNVLSLVSEAQCVAAKEAALNLVDEYIQSTTHLDRKVILSELDQTIQKQHTAALSLYRSKAYGSSSSSIEQTLLTQLQSKLGQCKSRIFANTLIQIQQFVEMLKEDMDSIDTVDEFIKNLGQGESLLRTKFGDHEFVDQHWSKLVFPISLQWFRRIHQTLQDQLDTGTREWQFKEREFVSNTKSLKEQYETSSNQQKELLSKQEQELTALRDKNRELQENLYLSQALVQEWTVKYQQIVASQQVLQDSDKQKTDQAQQDKLELVSTVESLTQQLLDLDQLRLEKDKWMAEKKEWESRYNTLIQDHQDSISKLQIKLESAQSAATSRLNETTHSIQKQQQTLITRVKNTEEQLQQKTKLLNANIEKVVDLEKQLVNKQLELDRQATKYSRKLEQHQQETNLLNNQLAQTRLENEKKLEYLTNNIGSQIQLSREQESKKIKEQEEQIHKLYQQNGTFRSEAETFKVLYETNKRRMEETEEQLRATKRQKTELDQLNSALDRAKVTNEQLRADRDQYRTKLSEAEKMNQILERRIQEVKEEGYTKLLDAHNEFSIKLLQQSMQMSTSSSPSSPLEGFTSISNTSTAFTPGESSFSV